MSCITEGEHCRILPCGVFRERHREMRALQRLFSTFPGGWPGAALLLLRGAVGVTSIAQGAFYPLYGCSWTFQVMMSFGVLIVGGALLLVGLLTPLASALVGLGGLAMAISWIPAPIGNLLDGKLGAAEVVVMAAAVGLLGPGAFSIDGYLFGRREIVISAASRAPKS